MFSKTNRSHKGDVIEHLIVELKAPKVKIGSDELTQIKSYAAAIANDERFPHEKTKWEFWIISNEMDNFAKMEATQANRPKGIVWQAEEPNITVWVKTWSEVIEQNKSRIQFFKEKLDHDPDGKEALKSVAERYSTYLSELKLPGEEEIPDKETE